MPATPKEHKRDVETSAIYLMSFTLFHWRNTAFQTGHVIPAFSMQKLGLFHNPVESGNQGLFSGFSRYPIAHAS